jgi:methylmalonyl-CoA mutase N-terminal domain/subunit
MVEAIESGYPQREIAESSYRFQQSVESRERIIVGVNDFVADGDDSVHVLYIDEGAGRRQLERLDDVRRRRDAQAVDRALAALREAAEGSRNTMEPLLEAVRAYATIGEMCDALRVVWGEYVEQPVI